MGKKRATKLKSFGEEMADIADESRLPKPGKPGKPSTLLDTGGQALAGRVIYCGDCLRGGEASHELLKNLPDACVDRPFTANFKINWVLTRL